MAAQPMIRRASAKILGVQEVVDVRNGLAGKQGDGKE
jgi:hypothetical protein